MEECCATCRRRYTLQKWDYTDVRNNGVSKTQWDSFYDISEQELNDGIVNSLDDKFTVRKFRFWSSKPTDEQRKAVKWDD